MKTDFDTFHELNKIKGRINNLVCELELLKPKVRTTKGVCNVQYAIQELQSAEHSLDTLQYTHEQEVQS